MTSPTAIFCKACCDYHVKFVTGGEHGGSVFAAPINGKVLKLLSHHIVHGEIVVPGQP